MSKESQRSRGQHRLILPATIIILLLFGLMILQSIRDRLAGIPRVDMILPGMLGVIYTLLLYFFFMPSPSRLSRWKWLLAICNGIFFGLLIAVTPDDLRIIPVILFIATTMTSTIAIGSQPTYLYILLVVLAQLFHKYYEDSPLLLLIQMSPYALAIVILEVLTRQQEATQRHIRRLVAINEFSQQITTSLETDQVVSLINAAIRKAINADTYYVAFVKDGYFELRQFYDDGEYFDNILIPMKGTIASRVIRNRSSILIQDLPKEQSQHNLNFRIIGKDKVSLSWMGAPIQAGQTMFGILAVASYRKNAFDQGDLELIENLAQQAALALDNAQHHTQVRKQSQLDSLTGALNHGSFLQVLQSEADKAMADQSLLSLIMLDIDHFKQYNDQYGHLVGDEVLRTLIEMIRGHIKGVDSIGRWGGEEFAILLPNASGSQALKVAARIQKAILTLMVADRTGKKIPAPTVSQGIAVFPIEMDEIYKLIDLADQRLYVAKKRGRNQIEPPTLRRRKRMKK